MQKGTSSIALREPYNYTKWDEFLWWLSTAEKELLASCVVDRNRYRIVGTTVLATWSFATLAWTYFWFTITPHILLAVLLGLFMGFIILTIDRALIKGMNKYNRNKTGPFLLRGLLAITLGTFMAQPAILFMFDKEIRLQASIDNEKRKRAKQQELDSLYNPQKEILQREKVSLQNQLETKYNEVTLARQQYLSEIDGTGGSGKVGIHTIALAKKTEYDSLFAEYNRLNGLLQPLLMRIDSILVDVNNKISLENKAYAGLLNNGFLTRIEALSNLVKANEALQWRYILIVIILMLIELMPVLAKTLIPSGTYDEKVKLKEELEKEIAVSNQVKERDLKELYNTLARENDEKFLREFFTTSAQKRHDKMKQNLAEWSEQADGSIDDYWEKVKNNIMFKQEN